MRKKAFLTIFTLLFFLALLLSVTTVRANVPSVLQISVVGDKTIAEIRHSAPSSSHFVETVEVRAKCITHGWSNWTSFGVEEPTDDGGGIPGFPLLSVLAGVALLMLLQRTRIPTLD